MVDAYGCKCVDGTMATAGLYEASGDWLFDTGLPGKSGISGGIVSHRNLPTESTPGRRQNHTNCRVQTRSSN